MNSLVSQMEVQYSLSIEDDSETDLYEQHRGIIFDSRIELSHDYS